MESPRTLIHGSAPPREPPLRGPARVIARAGSRRPDAAAQELVLGRYRLLERLGAGGFGEVWRAHDELLHREVAVKRVPLGPELDAERAIREAHASARLAHPAIVALYEACPGEDCLYLISELIDGDTLAGLIAGEELSDEEVLLIGAALVDALEHAHSRGVVHRDIKPQNVLVPSRAHERAIAAKLADFGGASLAGEDGLTRTGDVLGTLAYMAPEQSEGREVGEQADLYSLALVLYEALSGVNPVRGPTPAATARRIGSRLEPLQRRRRDLPRQLARAIDKALDPSPRRRGHLQDLGDAIADALQEGLPTPRRRMRSPPPREAATALAPVRRPGVPRAVAPSPAPAPAPASALPGPELQPAGAPSVPQERHERAVRMALPRGLWLGLSLAAILWQLAAGRSGLALLTAAALAPLLALPRRSGPGWLACALAPVLGFVGLAGAFPALAGQPRRLRSRLALGALGYWWLTLAGPLLGRRLWLEQAAHTPPRAVWEASLASCADHVIGPLLSSGVLLGVLLWGLAAAALPLLVRGRSALTDLLAAGAWSAALVLLAPSVDGGLAAGAHHAEPRGAVLGAILGCATAVAARAVRGPVRSADA